MLLAALALVGVLLLGPLGMIASGEVDPTATWRSGSRDSSGQAPLPADEPRAVVQVYAARTVGWRGAFGVHTWIATKRRGADAYTVNHVIGWRVFRGAGAVVTQPGPPDFRWFGAWPEKLVDLPPNAIGKDWLPGTIVAATPSGTGWQLSLAGLLGVAVGIEEGLEFNVLGLSVGIDANDFALRLPGFGRVGPGLGTAEAAAPR